MDQNMYKGIIKDIMLPHANDKMLRGWTFQHDYDPKHTSKLVTEFLAQKKVRILEWPSQSPDLNPIEHLWEHIERKISVRKPSNQHNLFELIKCT